MLSASPVGLQNVAALPTPLAFPAANPFTLPPPASVVTAPSTQGICDGERDALVDADDNNERDRDRDKDTPAREAVGDAGAERERERDAECERDADLVAKLLPRADAERECDAAPPRLDDRDAKVERERDACNEDGGDGDGDSDGETELVPLIDWHVCFITRTRLFAKSATMMRSALAPAIP